MANSTGFYETGLSKSQLTSLQGTSDVESLFFVGWKFMTQDSSTKKPDSEPKIRLQLQDVMRDILIVY